jgi:hypothetical protein
MTARHRQCAVSVLVRDRPGFRQLYRARYWIREGYVEELFELRR